MRKLILACGALIACFNVTNAYALIIDNGTMVSGNGGSCSSCNSLDTGYLAFDNLSIASDTTLNSVDFELLDYWDSFGDYTDLTVEIWNTTHTIATADYNFRRSDTGVTWSLDATTKIISFGLDMGDAFIAAGEYVIGIGGDRMVVPRIIGDITQGADGSGGHTQWVYSSSTFCCGSSSTELPFRLQLGTPVPEPTSLALCILGLAGLRFSRRKS